MLEQPQPCRGTRLGLCKLQGSPVSQVLANSCGKCGQAHPWRLSPRSAAHRVQLWGERGRREEIKVMMRRMQ